MLRMRLIMIPGNWQRIDTRKRLSDGMASYSLQFQRLEPPLRLIYSGLMLLLMARVFLFSGPGLAESAAIDFPAPRAHISFTHGSILHWTEPILSQNPDPGKQKINTERTEKTVQS
jgi:hypothetical protein